MHSRTDEIGPPKRSPWKVAVYKDPHPGQETPNLKTVESWESVGRSITFFAVLMLFLRHLFTGDCWRCNTEKDGFWSDPEES